MNIKTKFNIGDKFKVNKEHLNVMRVNENDVFKIDSIRIDQHGIYYSYYKFPEHKNRTWNKKWRNSKDSFSG